MDVEMEETIKETTKDEIGLRQSLPKMQGTVLKDAQIDSNDEEEAPMQLKSEFMSVESQPDPVAQDDFDIDDLSGAIKKKKNKKKKAKK